MKLLFLCFYLLGVQTAMASFVNSCMLKGSIASEPKKSAQGVWSFEFTVKSAEKFGRTDSGCDAYVGKKLTVSLDLEDEGRTLKNGEALKLHKFEKKNTPQNSIDTYSLIKD